MEVGVEVRSPCLARDPQHRLIEGGIGIIEDLSLVGGSLCAHPKEPADKPIGDIEEAIGAKRSFPVTSSPTEIPLKGGAATPLPPSTASFPGFLVTLPD
ncbi:MAG: hypothetical protein QXY83_06455 [Thermosphaera sp.]